MRILHDWRMATLAGLGALVLWGGGLLWVWALRQKTPPAPAPAGVTVIPLPSATAAVAAPPRPAATPSPQANLPPSPPPGRIAAGAFVQIRGTEGKGLRLRSEPGLKGAVNYLGMEAEVFQVQDGPVAADGYTWWYLVAPYDATKQGWAASNYLQVVQSP